MNLFIPVLRFVALALVFGVASGHAAEKKRSVTTFTVLQDMAQNVAGDSAIVESITKPGAEIRGYEPTPQVIVKAQHADLVLWNGLNLERWFEKFYRNLRDVPRAVRTEGIEPIGIEEGPYTGEPNPTHGCRPAPPISGNAADALLHVLLADPVVEARLHTLVRVNGTSPAAAG